MDWQVAAAAVAGIVGQYLKSLKNVPSVVPQAVMLLVGVTVYVAYNPPKADGWAFVQYLIGALVAGASVNGVASIAGSVAPSLKTDSR